MALPKSALRDFVTRHLSPSQELWLVKLRHGEHSWQRSFLRRSKRTRDKAFHNRQAERDRLGNTTLTRGRDARKQVARNLADVQQRLNELAVPFIKLPSQSVFEPTLVINSSDLKPVLQMTQDLQNAGLAQTQIYDPDLKQLPIKLANQKQKRVGAVSILPRLQAENGQQLSTKYEAIRIEPWDLLPTGTPRVDGETHLPGTLHRRIKKRDQIVEYLTPEQWNSGDGPTTSQLHLPAPHIYEITEPIDIVYTWVDGSDPDWVSKRANIQSNILQDSINSSAISDSRFLNRDELKFSLRSVEAYASWVNHIYIVTDGQTPPWLNADHPRITVIDHKEIFKDPTVLPVFNSHAIESQLHHIPNLSEQYLYINDDIFFMRPTEPDKFFTSSGLSKFFPSTAPLDLNPPSARDMPVLSAAKNNRTFILKHYNRTITNKFRHTPHPQLKSVMESLERDNHELFSRLASSQFRHPDDYSVPSALFHNYAYLNKKAIKGSLRYVYIDIEQRDLQVKLNQLTRRTDVDVLCINDTNSETIDAKRTKAVTQFLETVHPVPSSFEK